MLIFKLNFIINSENNKYNKMKNVLIVFSILFSSFQLYCQDIMQMDVAKYKKICQENIYKDYKGMLKEPKGVLKYPYVTPGSQTYATQLWDWDSWFSSIALDQITANIGTKKDKDEVQKYEQGCVLNFLSFQKYGWIPIVISHDSPELDKYCPENPWNVNIHKPMLAQQAAFITQRNDGDATWLNEKFEDLQFFVNHYISNQRHKETGLYFWINDEMIGIDNDPATFFRPEKSSANIFLNCLMYKELLAMVYLCKQLNREEIGIAYANEAESLKQAIRKNCWDEWTGFYYSCDLNLLPIKAPDKFNHLHSGNPRTYSCLIQRLHTFTGFMAMWAGIATPEQAKRMVEQHYKDTATLNCNYGIRSMSKLEKMYDLRATGNPSSWLGPVWGVSNYIVFRSLVNYGYNREAKEIAEKTILLFGKDYEQNGALHEYYLPDSGMPVLNKGFQDWNYLVINMAAWLDGNQVIHEF